MEKNNKTYRLYLDDCRIPIDGDWILVKNYDEIISKILEIGLENIEMISLDHDLGYSSMLEFNNTKNNYIVDYGRIIESTGYDVAKWLVNHSIETEIPLPQIYTHSANPIGSANIMGYINCYLMNCNLPQSCVRVIIPHI